MTRASDAATRRDFAYAVGDRVAFTGHGGGVGSIRSIRQPDDGTPRYLVSWDDGIGSDIEMVEDELIPEVAP